MRRSAKLRKRKLYLYCQLWFKCAALSKRYALREFKAGYAP